MLQKKMSMTPGSRWRTRKAVSFQHSAIRSAAFFFLLKLKAES